MPGNIRFDASEQDSLTYMAAEKIYIRGRVEQAKESFGKYLQTFPDGAFGLNAHYYLCLIGKEQKNYDMILEKAPGNTLLTLHLLQRRIWMAI